MGPHYWERHDKKNSTCFHWPALGAIHLKSCVSALLQHSCKNANTNWQKCGCTGPADTSQSHLHIQLAKFLCGQTHRAPTRPSVRGSDLYTLHEATASNLIHTTHLLNDHPHINTSWTEVIDLCWFCTQYQAAVRGQPWVRLRGCFCRRGFKMTYRL